jgi:hypothetical protein
MNNDVNLYSEYQPVSVHPNEKNHLENSKNVLIKIKYLKIKSMILLKFQDKKSIKIMNIYLICLGPI